MTTKWTPEEETAFAEIMKAGNLTRIEAIRLYRRAGGDIEKALRLTHRPPPRFVDDFPVDALRAFVAKYRLSMNAIRRDECNEPIIVGRNFATDMPDRLSCHSHIFDYGDGQHFGLCLMLASKRVWSHRKSLLQSARFTIKQEADSEAIALFDPQIDAQSKLAIKLSCVRRALKLSPQLRENLRQRGLNIKR